MAQYDKCSRCDVDPNLKEHEGRQIYVCDRCGAFVCSDCSEDGSPEEFKTPTPVVCYPRICGT